MKDWMKKALDQIQKNKAISKHDQAKDLLETQEKIPKCKICRDSGEIAEGGMFSNSSPCECRKRKKIVKNADNYVRVGWRRAWAMWDLDNGHSWGKNDPGKGYIWLFTTKKEALEHRRKQHKMKFGAKLSYPFKIEGDRRFI